MTLLVNQEDFELYPHFFALCTRNDNNLYSFIYLCRQRR